MAFVALLAAASPTIVGCDTGTGQPLSESYPSYGGYCSRSDHEEYGYITVTKNSEQDVLTISSYLRDTEIQIATMIAIIRMGCQGDVLEVCLKGSGVNRSNFQIDHQNPVDKFSEDIRTDEVCVEVASLY